MMAFFTARTAELFIATDPEMSSAGEKLRGGRKESARASGNRERFWRGSGAVDPGPLAPLRTPGALAGCG